MIKFEQADLDVVREALLAGMVTVALGRVSQAQVDARQDRLHQAALAQPEPVEILTVPCGGPGEVGLKVRRFK